MTLLSESPKARSWLDRFDAGERQTATYLIDEILLVSGDDFSSALNSQLDTVLESAQGSVALFAERPVKSVFGRIPSFFPGSRSGRAVGPGVAPIIVDPRKQEVGSEGIIGQLVTDYCRRNPDHCLTHPGPSKMRTEKVRKIVIVTDFIGSGDRVTKMLESFRYVATLRSWRSYKLIDFMVIAYSGLATGINNVRSHRLKPEVRVVMGCPTIPDAFLGSELREIEQLCRTHPKKHPEATWIQKRWGAHCFFTWVPEQCSADSAQSQVRVGAVVRGTKHMTSWLPCWRTRITQMFINASRSSWEYETRGKSWHRRTGGFPLC